MKVESDVARGEVRAERDGPGRRRIGSAVGYDAEGGKPMAIDAGKWTSDWYVARDIAAAYQDSRRAELCIICLGDPATPGGYLVKPVGDALAEYHPEVYGTTQAPVHEGNLAERWAQWGARWRERFQIVVAPRGGDDEEIGYIVTSRSPWRPGTAVAGVPELGHIVLYATVFFAGMEEAGVPANPHLERRAARAADVVVDGILRFFHKIGYDHTTFRQTPAGRREARA